MKKTLLLLAGALAFYMPASVAQTQRQDKCGMELLHKAMIAEDPSWEQKFEAQRASQQSIADNYIKMQNEGMLERTTATGTVSPIPVIFHIIVDATRLTAMGGTAGITKRIDSQVAVLNRDFNGENSDSTSIPSSWKTLYGNTGIQFGLARVDPSGNCSPGYELKVITACGFTDESSSYRSAKKSTTGLAAWDVTKYYNVWCINFVDDTTSCTSNGLLGITLPKSSTSGSTVNYEGVCMLYNSLGKSASGAGSFPPGYNLGRTLTHETGHFFEIWHPWGDDGGACPWSGGSDDGLADTPPESDATYGVPSYTITGGTLTDGCKMNGTTNTQPIGIACLSYMDYVNDNAMHLFTTQQAAVMASMALLSPGSSGGSTAGAGTIGENYSLTQHPALLIPCTTTGVTPAQAEINSGLNIYPNPSAGIITISVNPSAETLNDIVVMNMVGQQVTTVAGSGKDYYSIDLSGISKGIYFIRCNFASGSVIRKVLLQ